MELEQSSAGSSVFVSSDLAWGSVDSVSLLAEVERVDLRSAVEGSKASAGSVAAGPATSSFANHQSHRCLVPLMNSAYSSCLAGSAVAAVVASEDTASTNHLVSKDSRSSQMELVVELAVGVGTARLAVGSDGGLAFGSGLSHAAGLDFDAVVFLEQVASSA